MSEPSGATVAEPGTIRPAWRQPWAIVATTALLVVLAGFAWTLDGHFLGDDFGYVGRFFEYPLAKWPALFVQSWAGDMWGFQVRELRPMTALSFMLDARLWEGNAFGYRLTNLLLHAACASMVGLIAWRAAARDLACGIAAATLFALHPVHAEPVQWITGRVDVLATTFYLAGFLVFLGYRTQGGGARWLAVLGAIYVAAAFSKEFGLTLPLMFLLADATWQKPWRRWREWKTWAPYAICLAVCVGYFFCRRAAFGPGGVGAGVANLGGSDLHVLFAQRQLTYLGHLLPPLDRWWHEGAPLLAQHAVRTFWWAVVVAVIGFSAWRWGARSRPVEERGATVFFGLGWYLVATLPLVVTYISPRHLYLASAGVCVALALILRGWLRARAAFAAVVTGLSVFYAQRLPATMKPWHDAAIVSGRISRELLLLEPHAQRGGALLMDVPEISAGAYVWTWAVPFALRPPFTRERLDERMVVLESRGLYVYPHLWHEQPAINALKQVEIDGWIVQLLDQNPARRIPVPAASVRAAAEKFATEPLTQFPHESWRKFINELAPP